MLLRLMWSHRRPGVATTICARCYDARRKRTFLEPDLVTVMYAGSVRPVGQVVQPITPGQASFGMAIIGQKSSAGP